MLFSVIFIEQLFCKHTLKQSLTSSSLKDIPPPYEARVALEKKEENKNISKEIDSEM